VGDVNTSLHVKIDNLNNPLVGFCFYKKYRLIVLRANPFSANPLQKEKGEEKNKLAILNHKPF
jgi:hypothetical protein